jgi:iron complex transport system substrate-binding protein
MQHVLQVRTPASNVIANDGVSRQNIERQTTRTTIQRISYALFFLSIFRRRKTGRCRVLRKNKVVNLAKTKGSAIALSLFLMMMTAACRGSGAAPDGTGRSIVDDLNRTVTLPPKITRIVSLAPNLTESVFAVGAGDRLVGVTTFCNYPEEAKSIAKVGDTMAPNIETILALKPDIVLVSTASQVQSFLKTLDSNRIAVYVTSPSSLKDVFANLRQFGQMFGTEEKANNLVESLQKRATAVEWRAKGVDPTRVFVQISREPLFTVGKGSFMNGILEVAFARSVTADVESAYPKLSKETALALKPDAIILSDSEDNREPNEVFKNSPAVKSGRVYKINADLISRPGPRMVDAIEQIARDLHPEKFDEK